MFVSGNAAWRRDRPAPAAPGSAGTGKSARCGTAKYPRWPWIRLKRNRFTGSIRAAGFCRWAGNGNRFSAGTEEISPEEIAAMALYYRQKGNIGVAFTYNEPLVGYEFVRDTARAVREKSMLNVLVTNGTASPEVLDEISPYTDAMNIDLKGFTDRYYTEVLKGNRLMTMDFIREAVQRCHVELTTLVIPGENDTEEEMREISGWIAGLQHVYGGKQGREIPLHITRFFPRWHMTDRGPTDIEIIRRLVKTAEENLAFVYPGNC